MIMNYLNLVTAASFLSLIVWVESVTDNFKITYENLYRAGVDAYLENRWQDCVALIEKSVEDYIYYQTVIIQCRKRCQKNETENLFDENDQDLGVWYFQMIITGRALCLMKCQKSYFPNRPKASKETDDDFEKKVPYNYLQLCYFKIGEPEKAASCAYTFLIHNPGHEVMQTNLQYYMTLPNINIEKIKYLEPKDYQDLFLKGAQLYSEGKFIESIEVMELSLKEYLSAEEDCRFQCEGPMLESSKEELFVAITNHFTYALRCNLNCPRKLAYMYGHVHEDLLASHYHYLQFSYFKIQKLKETCEAVASFLLFHPDDKTMLSNKNFYSKQTEVSQEWFSPRKEALEYMNRYKKEKDFLRLIETNFQFDAQASLLSPLPPPGSKSHITDKPKLGKKRKKLSDVDSTQWFEKAGIMSYLNEKDLNGTNRAAFTNLVSKEECQQLMDLALEGGVHGDGYNGRESPHTEFEMFEGLTVARAATLSQRGILNPLAAFLFLNISEKARQAVELFFDLDTELFFAYTHLVCRTALPDSPGNRSDLSHPIHADNCVLRPDGECLKEKPAYTWRDYSAILYLNEDFEGGEFIFAKDKNNIQAMIKPKCGLTVAFSAGEENLHGVKAVKKGRRCALAMWYTLDSRYREKERDFANAVLADLWTKRKLSSRSSSDSYEKSTLYKFAEDAKHFLHEHSEL